MTKRYWNIDGGLQLLVETNAGEQTTYHALNQSGKWQDGIEDAISYVFDGEPGAVQIEEPAAAALAAKLGSSLEAVPALEG